MGKKRRQYTREFKVEAVKLVTEGGLSVAQTARGLGVSQSVLHRWKCKSSSDPSHAFPGVGHLKPEVEELRQLRLENARLRQERDIIKKAATICSERTL